LPNDTFSYTQDYLNTIYSGYATYSDNFYGIGFQLGLRSEYFARLIEDTGLGEPAEFNKFMFYPSVHLSKSLNDKHQLQLSYSRRINRPQAWLLNNTPSYIDPYNIFKGSPFLKPEYTDAYEFNYRVVFQKVTFSAQSYFRYTTNLFTSLRNLQSNGIMVHQLTNSKDQTAYGQELGFDFNIFKWWQINTGTNIYHYSLRTLINSDEKTSAINTWDARLVSSFNLKWGTRLQAVTYMRGKNKDAMGTNEGFYTCNLAVNQSLMKGKANIGLSAQNIFNSIKFDYLTQSNTFNNKYNIQAEGPIIMLNFSYSFNNFQNKNRGRADDLQFKGGGAF
jgi:outer membrane receptor protein involved in Fe transport